MKSMRKKKLNIVVCRSTDRRKHTWTVSSISQASDSWRILNCVRMLLGKSDFLLFHIFFPLSMWLGFQHVLKKFLYFIEDLMKRKCFWILLITFYNIFHFFWQCCFVCFFVFAIQFLHSFLSFGKFNLEKASIADKWNNNHCSKRFEWPDHGWWNYVYWHSNLCFDKRKKMSAFFAFRKIKRWKTKMFREKSVTKQTETVWLMISLKRKVKLLSADRSINWTILKISIEWK